MNEREIFIQAARITDPGEQAAYLGHACGTDESLRRRLVDLLSAHARANNFLEVPPSAIATEFSSTTAQPPLERPGTLIGSYKLLEVIGEGGMGVVYMAEQTEPVERRVALKIIKPGMDSRKVVSRFEAERQALAMMDHQNIAKVFDVGTTESGRPYFVMELVKGVPINKYCDENRLSLKQRLELMIPICQAIQHAHQKGIIHRDIKPTNVLVAQHDGRPVPKVIDFGVAKAMAQKPTERTMFTELGQIVGTLEYMSPEQAELNQLDIDTRSDIYSLGVLLYELLTGSTPFDKQKLRSAAFAEMLRIIREDEPPKPSTKLSTIETLPSVAANRQTEPVRLSKAVRGELDWIVMKALEKDRNRRYETANGFAADIQRYLSDEPVQACPPSAVYRFCKFARRNKAALTTAVLVALALLLGTVMSTWQAIRASHAESQAKANESLAIAQEKTARDEKQKAIAAALAETVARQAETKERQRAEEGEQQADRNFESAIEAVDRLLAHVGSDDLFEIPHAQPFRQKILHDALQFYEQFKSKSGNSPAVRHRLARTWTHMAYLMEELGDPRAGQTGHQVSIETMEQLLTETPNRIEYLETLGNACMQGARQFEVELRNEKGAVSQAVKLYARCVEIFAQLSQAEAEPTESTPYASGSFVNRQLHAMLGLARISGAEEKRRLAVAALELAERAGDLAMPARVYALLLNGEIITTSSPDQADEYFRQGIALYRKWLAENEAGKGRHEQSSFGSRLAQVARNGGFKSRHPQEAEALYREAIDIKKKVVNSFPSHTAYRISLAGYQTGLANNLLVKARGKMAVENPSGADLLRKEAFSLIGESLAGVRWLVAEGHEFCRDRLVSIHSNKTNQLIIEFGYPSTSQLKDIETRRAEAQHLLTDAVQYCHQLIAEFPDDASYRDNLAALLKLLVQRLADAGKLDEARQIMKLFDPRKSADYVARSKMYEALGDRKAAQGDYQKALEMEPGEFQESLALAEELIKANPERYQVWIERGQIYDRMGQYENAIRDYSTAIEIAPKLGWLYKYRGRAYFRLARNDEALTDIARVIEFDVRETNALLWISPWLVAACADEKFRAGMLALADKTIELNTARKEHASGARARLYKAQQLWDRVRADLEKAIASGQAVHDSKAYRQLCGDVLLQFRDSREPHEIFFAVWICSLATGAVDDYLPVIELARRAVKLRPDDVTKPMLLGATLFRAGCFAEALDYLGKPAAAKQMQENDPTYGWYFLAMTHHKLGHSEEARQWYDKAVEYAANLPAGTTAVISDDPVSWNRRLTLELLRAEAARLLGVTVETGASPAGTQPTNTP